MTVTQVWTFLFQIDDIQSGTLVINTFVAKTTMSSLAETTASIDTMFGNDINITSQVMNRLLQYENKQAGLTLTSEQDSRYVTVSLQIWSFPWFG